MPNITWCDLPTDVSLWPGLPLSLSGDEVMPLDYHAGRSGWLLYGRGLDKQRLTQYQSKLGAAMVIVAAWCVEDYQVIRLAGSLTQRDKEFRYLRTVIVTAAVYRGFDQELRVAANLQAFIFMVLTIVYLSMVLAKPRCPLHQHY